MNKPHTCTHEEAHGSSICAPISFASHLSVLHGDSRAADLIDQTELSEKPERKRWKDKKYENDNNQK